MFKTALDFESTTTPLQDVQGSQLTLSRWLRLKELLVTKLVGWVPRIALGVVLRRLFYRAIFARIGSSVCIENGVEFYGTSNIELADSVRIARNVRIDAQGQNNKVYIGSQAVLERGVVIVELDNSNIEIGDRTFINADVWINGFGHIKIGQDCLIGPRSAIISHNRHFADPTRKINLQESTGKGVSIGDDCWLGYGVTVLDGVTIGQGSVIGAGAVVTKDIPPYSVAVGVPARVVGQRRDSHQAVEFHPDFIGICEID
ncbi:MAG TPA: acyltransferase [Allocoleopsis sp.]